MDLNYKIGIDIGGTNIRIAVVNAQDQIVALEKMKTPADDYYQGLKQIVKIIKNFQQSYEFNSIGIGCPGPLDPKRGVLLDLPNLPDWRHRYLVTDLMLFFANMRITLENDANVAALGHYLQLADHKLINGYLFFTFSTGIGAGYIYNQKIFSGAHGMGLELANVIVSGDSSPTQANNSILNQAAIEELCGGNGIVRQCTLQGVDVTNTLQVFDLYKKGDSRVMKIMECNKRRLAILFANSIAYLDPEVVAIGGPIALHNKAYFQDVFELVKQYLLPALQNRIKFEFVNDTSDNPALLGAAAL